MHRVPGGMAGAELVSRFKPREMEMEKEKKKALSSVLGSQGTLLADPTISASELVACHL